MRVLIADHDPDEVERLRNLIKGWGHSVLTASTGADALLIAELEQPHLAIVDTGLPDLSGLEVLRQIRLTPLGRQIAVVLANPDPKDDEVRLGFLYGSDAHLHMPLDVAG